MKKSLAFLTVLTCMLFFAQLASAQNLVANPGFETGDFSGWIQGGNTGATGVYTDIQHSGTYAAHLGPVGTDGSLSQSIATTIGETYAISFWLENQGGTPNDFSAYFGSSQLLGLLNGGPQGYTEYQASVVASSTTTSLVFDFRQDPSYWNLDDISVVQTGTSVPEPATMLLLGLGLVGLAGVRRKFKE